MIHTWVANAASLTNEKIYRYYYGQVPDFRKEKADRIQAASEKALSVGVWVLLERMRQAYGLTKEGVFNLSHSGDYVLCSVASNEKDDVKVGCDIETIKEVRMKVAERFFCDSEADYINALEGELQADAFYRFWVLKESFIKATRKGMGMDLRSFEIRYLEAGCPVLVKQPEEIRETYHYREYEVKGIKARIAVCSTSERFDEIRNEGWL